MRNPADYNPFDYVQGSSSSYGIPDQGLPTATQYHQPPFVPNQIDSSWSNSQVSQYASVPAEQWLSLGPPGSMYTNQDGVYNTHEPSASAPYHQQQQFPVQEPISAVDPLMWQLLPQASGYPLHHHSLPSPSHQYGSDFPSYGQHVTSPSENENYQMDQQLGQEEEEDHSYPRPQLTIPGTDRYFPTPSPGQPRPNHTDKEIREMYLKAVKWVKARIEQDLNNNIEQQPEGDKKAVDDEKKRLLDNERNAIVQDLAVYLHYTREAVGRAAGGGSAGGAKGDKRVLFDPVAEKKRLEELLGSDAKWLYPKTLPKISQEERSQNRETWRKGRVKEFKPRVRRHRKDKFTERQFFEPEGEGSGSGSGSRV